MHIQAGDPVDLPPDDLVASLAYLESFK